MTFGYIVAAVIGVPVIIACLAMIAYALRGKRRSTGGSSKLGDSSVSSSRKYNWRRIFIGAIVLVVGIVGWRWLRIAGNANPQLGLIVILIVGTIATVWVWRSDQYNRWVSFAFLLVALAFAWLSSRQGVTVQPGSALTAFGIGKWVSLVAVLLFAFGVIQNLVRPAPGFWFAAVIVFILGGRMGLEPFRHPEHHTVTVQRGGYKAAYGIARFRDGLVTVDADTPRGPDGIYSVFGLQSDGYERTIRVQDGQEIQLWIPGVPQADLAKIEVQLGSNGWVHPFADGRPRFQSPLKEGDLEVRLPPDVKTGIFKFGMRIYTHRTS